MQDKQKLVVVGSGMAGIRAVEELLKLAPDLYDITVIGAEPHVNYNRILLSPVLTGEQTLDDIILNREDWYASNGIRLLLGRKVTGLNRARRIAQLDDGATLPYDRLLLATGSNPLMLPVPGCELDGVVTFRDIRDVNLMIDAAARYRHAVVIGGGLLPGSGQWPGRARHGRVRGAPGRSAAGPPARRRGRRPAAAEPGGAGAALPDAASDAGDPGGR